MEELQEGVLDRVLRAKLAIRPAHEVQQRVVAQLERALQGLGLPEHHLLTRVKIHLVVDYSDGNPLVVFPAPAGPPAHLYVLAGRHVAVALTVPLAHLCEYHRLGGHVQTHCELQKKEGVRSAAMNESIQSDSFSFGLGIAIIAGNLFV